MLARQIHEGAKILGETVASETNAGVQKLTPNTGIESHAARHLGDIGTYLFAQVGHHIDEGNFGGQEDILPRAWSAPPC